MQKTYSQSKAQVDRHWRLVDANGQVVGRLATQLATWLMGKDKPTYTAHIDGGDYVVVINAEKVVMTRNKPGKKIYYSHSSFPGGLKETTFAQLLVADPTRILYEAVYSMLPKNKLRSGRMDRLKVYVGTEHPHASNFAQASPA